MFYRSVVELVKLFSNRSATHHYCFTSFFSKLENWKYGEDLQKFLNSNLVHPDAIDQSLSTYLHTSKETLASSTTSLRNELEQAKASIDRLILYRDKIYAHYDMNVSEYALPISLTDIERLLNLAKSIYLELHGRIYYTDTRFDFPQSKIKSIIKMIEKGYDL
jgi:hypothetical protein